MATGAQFASLDGTALGGEENEFAPDPKNIARRSISIFSRRGTETPEPKPPFIAQAAMPTPKQKPMTEKQKKWSKRKSAPATGNSPAKPKGTILNIVPPAKTIQMTPLEEEMASSPNDEILTKIGSTPTSPSAPRASLQLMSPTDPKDVGKRKSFQTLTQRTKSQKRRETNSRIGVWVNGVAHWDEPLREECAGSEEPSLQASTGFTPLLPNAAEKLNKTRTPKPQLSVVIPQSAPLINDTTISTIVEPMPQRPVVSVAPASIVSRFALSTPRITVEEPQDVSPLDSASTRRPTPPRERPRAPVNAEPTHKDQQQRPVRYSSSSSSIEHDDSSEYSKRSSATSVEALDISNTPERVKKSPSPDFNKPLPPDPLLPPQRDAPAPPSSPTEGKAARHASTKSVPGERKHDPFRRVKHTRSTRSMSHVDIRAADSPTLSEAEDDLEAHLAILSAAKGKKDDHKENDHDGAATAQEQNEESFDDNESTVARMGSVRRTISVSSVMHPPERAPTIPRRSRKREWRSSRQPSSETQPPPPAPAKRRQSETNLRQQAFQPAKAPELRRSASATELSRVNDLAILRQTPIEDLIPEPKVLVDDGLIVLHGPVLLRPRHNQDAAASSTAAEEVLLHILTALNSTEDLFNTALMNKGMYRVYKENEMDLIRTCSLNQSPAASEFREWCQPNDSDDNASSKSSTSSQLEHTPSSYMRDYRRDTAVIESLKCLILERCHTFIRRETAFALSTPSHPNAQRFSDAFWRIWCFCKIFGSGKGREEDVTGQLDWLKGGVLANNLDLDATMNMNLEYDMTSVLLNPPEFFAQGNAGGLSAQQLYDMTEIWTCLRSLLEGFHLQTEQAWECGVYDECDIGIGDEETEEQLLEEWTDYLLTLGPSVVLEMAEFSRDNTSAGFALAKVNGWTKWSPLESDATRSTFLKEPVSRLYEERVTAAARKLQNPREQERKDLTRKRVANLAAEIKLARQSSTFKRLPLIDMNSERPMSAMSRHNSARSATSTSSMRSFTPHRQTSLQRQSSLQVRKASTPITPTMSAQHSARAPNFSVPRPRSPPSGLWAPRKISPIIEDRVETFNRMSLQNFAPGVAEDTSDIAIRRITDMGFSAEQAREALRVTDMGDGLRVDRAVDMLLRQRG